MFDFSMYFSNHREDMILDSIVCLSTLILKAHIDIRDIQTVTKKKGLAYLSIGRSSGLNKITNVMEQLFSNVMEQLFSNSFFHDNIIDNTSSAILNITASGDLTIPDVDQILDVVKSKLGFGSNIIFGTIIDNEMHDTIMVSLVLTDCDKNKTQY